MYLLFRYHHILPSIFFEMGLGEKTVLRAFMRYQMEQLKEALNNME